MSDETSTYLTTAEAKIESNRQILAAWNQIASHPFFLPAFNSEKPLIEAMLEMLDRIEKEMQ